METNTRPSATHSNTSEGGDDEHSGASHRPAFAVQACETCRGRKTKCDERRPRCSLCEHLNVSCYYREPKPTKRDQTLVFILKNLRSLERKVDQLVLSPASPIPRPQDSTSHSFTVPAQTSTEIQRILTWPEVRRLLSLDNSDLLCWEGINENPEQWLVRITRSFQQDVPIGGRMNLQYTSGELTEKAPTSTTLTKNYVETLCSIYFQTFHAIYPIVDSQSFTKTILPRVCNHSFQEDDEGSALVLVILALGTLAYEGYSGNPIVDETEQYTTGIRGGSASRPPGLDLLNEGRRRMGFILTNWNLTSLQYMVLTAIYFSQCSRNMEYWHTTILSCTLCQNLLKINRRWDTSESDQLSRCYWMCHLLEGGPTGELQVDQTGITASNASVPLPQFRNAPMFYKAETEMFSHLCFLAQVSLRSIVDRIVDSQKGYRNIFNNGSDSNEVLVSEHITEELLRQLITWRQHLPSELAWDDEELANKSNEIIRNGNMPSKYSSEPPDMKSILAAALQTRYKYANYMIWRPFIYRFLHFQGALTDHDLQCCQKALNACLMWPISFPEFSNQRRLVPHLYEYSHSFFGILILMHLCTSSQSTSQTPILFSDPKTVFTSNGLLLYWMRDMQVVHPVACWCWPTLKRLYRDHPAVKFNDLGNG